MIEALKEQLQEQTTNEALETLYEMGIIKDKQIQIFMIKQEFKRLWRDTNRQRGDIIKELAARYDRSLEAVYKYVK